MVQDASHYRRSSYRCNALGQAGVRITPHPIYLALGQDYAQRQTAYRAMFRPQLDRAAIDDFRLALIQNQPIGNERFLAQIKKITGIRRSFGQGSHNPAESRQLNCAPLRLPVRTIPWH